MSTEKKEQKSTRARIKCTWCGNNEGDLSISTKDCTGFHHKFHAQCWADHLHWFKSTSQETSK